MGSITLPAPTEISVLENKPGFRFSLYLYRLMPSLQNHILLVTPPFTQLNTPYPATAYLKGFLNRQGIATTQMDLGMETILRLFTKDTLKLIFEQASAFSGKSENTRRMLALKDDYCNTIHEVIGYLQNENPTLAYRIAERNFLPEASRFMQLDDLGWAFGNNGMQDKAKYLCTLYLEDLGDLITETIDPHFGFSRYAERLGRSANELDEIYSALKSPLTLIEEIMLEELTRQLQTFNFTPPTSGPRLICFSLPFPGNLFSAFRCAQYIKKNFSAIKLAMGGGFPNTELRSLNDPRVFEFFDFVTLDDGERPLLCLNEFLEGKRELKNLKRTFALENGVVNYFNGDTENDFALRETGTPDYDGLPLKKYLSVIEMANPMHRLWSDGRWNKLTLAHGCYWGKCTFCDISLDYIQRYEPANAKMICDRMEEMMAQTGESGFHFVDEAAPPSLMKELAIEILRRNLKVTWWTNIRFEKSFTADLCRLLNASGCIAVSGGLEVASDRLLALIEKGVTVEQVASVCAGFTSAGIRVHAYLMYGFPSQTDQETIDSLEMVRQLFDAGIIQSGFWHRFALTAHSPVGLNPEKFGVKIMNEMKGRFANNDLDFIDKKGCDAGKYADGLRKSLFNFMHEVGMEFPLQDWFDFKIPKTKVKSDFIANAIEKTAFSTPGEHKKIIWIASAPEFVEEKTKTRMIIHTRTEELTLKLKPETAGWLKEIFPLLQPDNETLLSVKEIAASYKKTFARPFEMFLHSKEMEHLREAGWLMV